MSEKFVVPGWWLDLKPEKRSDTVYWGLVSVCLVRSGKPPAAATRDDVLKAIESLATGNAFGVLE